MSEIHVTIISSTVGKNPYKKWSSPHNKKKESRMQYLDAVSKMTE